MTVTPKEIVAPVCSEVIVAAGLCDGSGFYLTDQPLEWMIPESSVGEIVQVGRETLTGFTSFLRHSPQKIGTNYVRAYTSSIAQTIDRGTPNPLDDVSLGKGQSWISVTSPIEGTTFVTVWAPKEPDWERRRTTARIHWVDAKWTFPAPQIARFGQPVRLSARIMRSNGAPVAGWIVRYDVLGGPEASFGARGEKSAAPTTLGDGTATVELLPNSTTPGITQVGIQIVRPGVRGGLPDMVVGQGMTSVSWSSPGLTVRAAGPENVPIDGTLDYRVEVVNAGDLPARDVKLSFVPPRSLSVLSSSPAASPLGQTLVWRLGDVPPRSAKSIQVNCRATMAADIRACFRAESAERIVAEGCVSSRVFASALSIRMSGPQSASVGEIAQFKIELSNTSSRPLTNVVVRDAYDPGLSEVNGKASPLEIAYPEIAAGETRQFAITFRVEEPGKQCHRVSASSAEGHSAATSGCVNGVMASTPPSEAASQVQIRIQAPAEIPVGQQTDPADPSSFTGAQRVQVEVTNGSKTTLTNVRLEIDNSASLTPLEVSEGFQQTETGLVYWIVPQLRPGEKISRTVLVGGTEADPRAAIRATVTSDQAAEQTKEAMIRVVQPAAVEPRGPKAGPAAPAANAGNLTVTAADNPDPVKAGAEVSYLVDVSNRGTRADADIGLTFTLPAGFRLKTVSERSGRLQVQRLTSGAYELTPIASLAAGGKFGPITLKATAGAAGKGTFKVNVRSERNPRGFDVTTETTVLP